MASVDLKDAFYSIPVAQGQRKYLRFIWKGSLFQFLAMPNGLACAPRFFTKMLKPAFACLGEQGHKCFPYIDNCVVVADSEEECRASAEALAKQLDQLGFYIHPDKSVLVPTKELTFLGVKLNSEAMSVALCESKREKFSKAANELLAKKRMSVREVAGLVGLMVAYTLVMGRRDECRRHRRRAQSATRIDSNFWSIENRKLPTTFQISN